MRDLKGYKADDYLMLSGIQHFYFCKRQWCLIHIEQQWAENKWTAEGKVLHKKADNPYLKEKRKDVFISRGMPVSSKRLGLSGILDVVEFTKSFEGVKIKNKAGYWQPRIVEYKRGKEKKDLRDIVQLVAQVICLEEKYDIKIDESYLFYHSQQKRIPVSITLELRELVKDMADQMHVLYKKQITTKAETYKNCKECSLYDICMPRVTKKPVNVDNYMYKNLDSDLT